MKCISIFLFFAIIIASSTNIVSAQNIGINADGSQPDANAMLDIKASNKGILIPRISTASRTAIPNTKGLLVYDTDTNSFWYNDGSAWQQITNAASLNGTVNYVPKFTGTNTIGNSQILDNGFSVAMGPSCTAAGTYSFAQGIGSNSAGFSSVAMGDEATADGDYAIAIGNLTSAHGQYSVAIGHNCIAGAQSSIAMGETCTAGNYDSFAEGYAAVADGNLSIAMGDNITAYGDYSMIFGKNLYDGRHVGDLMMGDSDPWNAGSVGSGTDNQMICRFSSGYYFITGGNTNRTGMVANHGDNSWSQISDSAKKEKIIPVDGEQLLNKIAKFNLCTWNYKGQDPKIFRHYGPMAQDFHNAFGHDALGIIGNDTLIYQADFLGVSFTAIEALEKRTEKIEQQQNQILDLQKQNEMLSSNNEKMQLQLQTLLSTVTALNKKVETLAAVENKMDAVAKK